MRWLRALFGRPAEKEVPLYGPQGLTLTYSDGTVYENVPSVYVGHDPDDNCAVYEVMPPRAPDKDRPVVVDIDVIPPMTSITFPFKGRPKGSFVDDEGNVSQITAEKWKPLDG